ncbi:hypothetical protein GP486_003527 [Trichoglossum hirsutum]|uniref:Malonyl-CoA:ACP transacylase (MAT) domain-containing protein n=1 Tax=Trichoglossum hirsutum TaxID=265104 RepID=A0A9P8LD34_9PEZI|nr:hypothetical protein GP486_003527 [Trichoglossum hirsutum]
MGKELMEEFPAFVEDIRAMDRTLAELPCPPSWSIEDELRKPKKTSRVHLAEFSQSLCTAIQIALVNLFRSWHISPAAVVGHSSGEIAGGYACNALTAEEAIIVSYYRGEAARANTQVGGMAAVGLGRDEVAPYLAKGVIVACENSPSSVTLSGDLEVLDSVVARLKDELPDVLIRRLHVNMAYHSRTPPSSPNLQHIQHK